MKINPTQRKTAWHLLPEPKPTWEDFKRLLNQAEGDPSKAHDIHIQRLRRKFLRTVDFEAPPRWVDRFRIFVENAPAEMLKSWGEWVRN